MPIFRALGRHSGVMIDHFSVEEEAKTPKEARVKMACYGYDYLNVEELKLLYLDAVQETIEYKSKHPRSAYPGVDEPHSLTTIVKDVIKFKIDNPGKGVYANAKNGPYSIEDQICTHS